MLLRAKGPQVPDDPVREHSNRPFDIPRSSDKGTYSRSDILTGKTKMAWGDDQSAGVGASGENTTDPTTWPERFYQDGEPLRVPKTVIFSSFPFWTCWWKSATYYGTRDVIGQMFTPPFLFGNYYYFDMWNDVDITNTPPNDFSEILSNQDYRDAITADNHSAIEILNSNPLGPYQTNTAWQQFDDQLTADDKMSVHNPYWICTTTCEGMDCLTCDSVPSWMFTTCPIALPERFQQIICQVTNPYYTLHQQITKVFLAAKHTLESDPDDPIFVVVPAWLPQELYQTRNAKKKKSHEVQNGGHGGSANHKPCEVVDVIPCYRYIPTCWAPAYPDVRDARNSMPFPGVQVPWLLNPNPGFGVNVLHIYVGHTNVRYDVGDDIWGYQAWPLSPEGNFIGPLFDSLYLGSISTPQLAGQRSLIRDAGFDWGFVNHGAIGVYNNYAGIIEGAAENYKTNYTQYREYSTHLFTYPASWNFNWSLRNIFFDQERTCEATQFYFGFEFSDFASMYNTEDNNITDCAKAPAFLKFGETHNATPDSDSLRTAIGTFYPPIQQRVTDYYNGIEPGTSKMYDLTIDKNGLADFNVVNKGEFGGALMDPDGLVEYVRQYFRDHP